MKHTKFSSHPEAPVPAIAPGSMANARPEPAQPHRCGFDKALLGEPITSTRYPVAPQACEVPFLHLSQSTPVTPHSFISVSVNAANKRPPKRSTFLLPRCFLQFAFCCFSEPLPPRLLNTVCRAGAAPPSCPRTLLQHVETKPRHRGKDAPEVVGLGTSHLPAEGPSTCRPVRCPFSILSLFERLLTNEPRMLPRSSAVPRRA